MKLPEIKVYGLGVRLDADDRIISIRSSLDIPASPQVRKLTKDGSAPAFGEVMFKTAKPGVCALGLSLIYAKLIISSNQIIADESLEILAGKTGGPAHTLAEVLSESQARNGEYKWVGKKLFGLGDLNHDIPHEPQIGNNRREIIEEIVIETRIRIIDTIFSYTPRKYGNESKRIYLKPPFVNIEIFRGNGKKPSRDDRRLSESEYYLDFEEMKTAAKRIVQQTQIDAEKAKMKRWDGYAVPPSIQKLVPHADYSSQYEPEESNTAKPSDNQPQSNPNDPPNLVYQRPTDTRTPVDDAKLNVIAHKNYACSSVATANTSKAFSTVPVRNNKLFGREEEVKSIVSSIKKSENSRIFSIVAPPCVGKTSVGEEVARNFRENSDWFVHHVDLTEVESADSIAYATTHQLDGLEPMNGLAYQQSVAALLDEKGDCLVVLDNFEHLTRFARETILVWVRNAANLRVLVTSRKSLGLESDGELKYRLQPLKHASISACKTRNTPLNEIYEKPAFQLFIDRAKCSSSGGFDFHHLTEKSIRCIGRIVARCGGFPASIEWAATPVIELDYNFERLERRLIKFAFNSKDENKPERKALHPALESLIDFSLTDCQRSQYLQFCYFAGEFTRDAAQEILCIDEDEFDDLWIALFNNTLIRPANVDMSAQSRAYEIYLPIREYLQINWENEATEEQKRSFEDSFRRYYLGQATELNKQIASYKKPTVLKQIAKIRDNLRQIIERDIEGATVSDAIFSLRTVSESYLIQGPASDYLDLCNQLWERNQQMDVNQQAEILAEKSKALGATGQFDDAFKDIDTAVKLFTPDTMSAIYAECLHIHSRTRHGRYIKGYHEKALKNELHAKSIFLELEDPRGGLLNGGPHLDWLGRNDEAIAVLRESIKAAAKIGDPYQLARTRNSLGIVYWHDGQLTLAIEEFNLAKAIFVDLVDENFEGACLTNTGFAASDIDDYDFAEDQFKKGHEIFFSRGNRAWRATNLVGQARLKLRRGQFDETLALVEDIREIIGKSEYNENTILLNIVEGVALAMLEKPQEALVKLLDADEALTVIGANHTMRSFAAKVSLMNCYLTLGEKQKARAYITKVRRIAEIRKITKDYPVTYLRATYERFNVLCRRLKANP